MIVRIIDHAVKVFDQTTVADTGEPMTAGVAWIEAVHDMIQTDGDALGVAVDVFTDADLSAQMLWTSDGADTFADFIRDALVNMSHLFELLVIAKIAYYADKLEHRKSLVR